MDDVGAYQKGMLPAREPFREGCLKRIASKAGQVTTLARDMHFELGPFPIQNACSSIMRRRAARRT
jgi:hypothetical protein